ncbi:peptidoglycan D,D-transpeptidase FtsI family protein [Demequina mangrovi]|uniref:Cell division protein FtsI (Penicillin-binding protein 3) n=1 Tax=Demequina mangrovi TaxID=1043493 RepID=A0A1H6Z4Y3_9MICO|nr:penicillin-binding protein 2 [Demequina mangrovi]SEJ47054.1 cell division protein FtsI (penicillin-binding protein 3) [Demequina mangrovi]
MPSSRAPRLADPRLRQRIIALALLAVLVVFAGRLVMVQAVNSKAIAADALQQRLVTSEITVPRADIVDRDGVVLATSVERYNVGVNQQKILTFTRTEDGQVVAEGPAGAAEILAPILDMDADELGALMVGDSTFRYLVKDISPETWELIAAEKIVGIEPEKVEKRIYPNGALAGNVVGFMGGTAEGTGTTGLTGVEAAYQDELEGTPGERTYEKDNTGAYMIPTGVQEETAAVPGQDVVLSIDRDIQWYAQERAQEAMAETGASQATVVVQDTTTGEILALVDSDSVDPNDPAASDSDDRGARSVSTVFEPGSTAKVITMAAALEEGVATPLTRFTAPYRYTTKNDQTFTDSHDYGEQKLTLAGILAVSSNTGTVQVGEMLTAEQRWEYLDKFGFGQTTGVGLLAESPGILHDWEDWDGRTTWAVTFGQGVAVTALQTTQVYSIVANGGLKIQPTVVKGFRDADGTFTEVETAEPERVISESTATQLMTMLEDVTQSGGTGVLAKIDGYRVAGKTGTAQATGADGRLTSYVASFVGIAPADDPRIVVSVILRDPKTEIWGGTTAAPVFKDVATFALQSLRVPPSTSDPVLYPTTWE